VGRDWGDASVRAEYILPLGEVPSRRGRDDEKRERHTHLHVIAIVIIVLFARCRGRSGRATERRGNQYEVVGLRIKGRAEGRWRRKG
jgi:hypothetical protein